MNSDLSFFESRSKELDSELKTLNSINNRLSFLRLVVFVCLVADIIISFSSRFTIISYIIGFLLILFFVLLCVFNNKSIEKERNTRTLYQINNEYINRIKGNFDSISCDNGSNYDISNHEYSVDLDVVGDHSLFSLYNVSETVWGKVEFARNLLGRNLDMSLDSIKLKQTSVNEFISNPIFLQEYQACARRGKISSAPKALIDFASDNNRFPSYLKVLRLFQPLLWIIPVVLFIIGNKYASASAITIAAVNLVLWFVFSSKFSGYFKSVRGISRQINSVSKLFNMLSSSNFESEHTLKLIKGGADEDATIGLNKLKSACTLCGYREQPLFALILNCIFPFDLLCEEKLINWSTVYGSELLVDLDCLGKLESLMSASVVGIISKYSVFPAFVDCSDTDPDNANFNGEEIYHPLIDPNKVVANSISIKSTNALITGSNMSGKTTMIRTIGTCCILAYIGAPVPAKSLTLGRMKIMSSMRIVDNLEEQMSTFRCELVRIGKIVAEAANEKPMLYLIDEIFRGTNSKDRTDGAMAVLKKLDRNYIIGLMTTHDYALCDIAKNELNNIAYYHFAEEYTDDSITFDYKLKQGVSNKSNAIYLMKLVGIVE